MSDIPQFKRYGANSDVGDRIQPSIALRDWSSVSVEEKRNALQQLYVWKVFDHKTLGATRVAVRWLNSQYLQVCPGKHLHKVVAHVTQYGDFENSRELDQATSQDFAEIFVKSNSSDIVMELLSAIAHELIDQHSYGLARKYSNEPERTKWVESAFKEFDQFARYLNHIFAQLAVNQLLTRNGLVPRQDDRITTDVYVPTLRILADPKWQPVSEDLAKMFADYRDGDYAEVITKGHSALQRFLQILVSDEGASGKGELSRLFAEAKREGLIPVSRFTEPIINAVQGYFSSERATKSTAKPAVSEATPTDAMLFMNVLMVFIQFCLQKTR